MRDYKVVNVNQLNEMAAGSRELVEDLVRIFSNQVSDFSVQLDSLNKNGDYVALGKLAHKIKGSVSMIGITELADYMKELETLAKESKQVEKYPDLISKYKTMSAEAIIELKDILTDF